MRLRPIQTRNYGIQPLVVDKYHNGRLAIVIGERSEPIGVLTVNLPLAHLEDGEIIVKAWSENEQLAADALLSGQFIDTGKRIPTGYVEAQVWRVKK